MHCGHELLVRVPQVKSCPSKLREISAWPFACIRTYAKRNVRASGCASVKKSAFALAFHDQRQEAAGKLTVRQPPRGIREFLDPPERV